ncbi:MAG: DcaP family trimeric outer membrane transporter [Alphaproteobacteria bacterium]|nr:DcaP family trimeric outer membrane transporter [Alphaproteobacteria bacterium]
MFKSNLRSALLGSGAAVAMVAVAAPASAGEIEDLRAQIEALQGKLDTLETRQDAVESQGAIAPAAAVEAGDKPKSWKLPGTNTSMNIGGYAKLDLLMDLGPFLGDSYGGSVPVTDNSTGDLRKGTFRAHARQSRFWLKTWTPTDWGELATHIEADFAVNNIGNEIVSNSNALRLRHAYGRLGPVLGGQFWSNFMGFESNAETIDFGGPTGTVFIRQAQLKYTHVFGGSGFSAAVAVENAETTGQPQGGTGPGSGNVSATGGNVGQAGPGVGAAGIAVDRAPDLTGKVVYKHSKGVIVGRGLMRFLGVDSGGGGNSSVGSGLAVSDNAVAWAFGVNGTWRFGPKDAIGGEFNYGRGLGRYLIGSARHAFVCTSACSNNASGLKLSTNFGGYGWYQHKWTDTIRSNIVGGYSQNELDVNAGTGPPLSHLKSNVSAHGNIIWSPVSAVNFGLEVLYARTVFHQQGNNDALRFQIGMQFKF